MSKPCRLHSRASGAHTGTETTLSRLNPKIPGRISAVSCAQSRRTSPGKAVGFCGWAVEDLQLLPSHVFRQLVDILVQYGLNGLSPSIMQARTVLLAKREPPEGIQDGRPITICSVLYRLFTRVISRQIQKTWSEKLPASVTGCISGRGVRSGILTTMRSVEECLYDRGCLAGFVLDLVKAFNLIPRVPIRMIFRQLGIPDQVCDFWLSSLKVMTRRPQVRNLLGAISASTGVPEGDPMAPCAMNAISLIWALQVERLNVQPVTYVDNWEWSSTEVESHKKALKLTQDVVDSLRMQIDFRKSWAWAVDQDSKDAWKTIVEHCAQTNKHFKLVLEAKDLGEQMLYSQAHRIGVHRDRLGKADKKFPKLFRRGSDLGTVAMVIQTNIWPTALHSADLQYLGKDHFHALRVKASQALAGKCKAASSWLSCHFLHHTLQDPGLYVLAKAATQVRKRAVFDMPFARSFVLRASQPCPGSLVALHRLLVNTW